LQYVVLAFAIEIFTIDIRDTLVVAEAKKDILVQFVRCTNGETNIQLFKAVIVFLVGRNQETY